MKHIKDSDTQVQVRNNMFKLVCNFFDSHHLPVIYKSDKTLILLFIKFYLKILTRRAEKLVDHHFSKLQIKLESNYVV